MAVLDEKKHPCPKCGGTDRFRCLDADTAALFCNQCFRTKNGDGFAAIQWLKGWTFPEALQAVAETLNLPGSRNGHTTNGKARGFTTKPSSNGKAKRDNTGKGKPFSTDVAAVAALCRMMMPTHGPPAGQWTYHDAAGKPIALVLRFNGADGSKEFRPVSLHDGSWFIKGPATPRPLYGVPDVATAATVYVCEGEKTADAARSLGIVAVTSMNGALSPDKTDWTPLAGKNVVILPDNDEPGRKYAEAVAAILATLLPSPLVKIVELPGLTEGDDLVEWIAVYRAMGSLAFAAAARAVWHVGKDHEDDKRRLILMAKINVCEEATGLAYRLKDGAVCWEEMPVAMTADEYLASERAASEESAEQRGDLQEAIDYLLDTLRDGPRATKDVEADAKSHDITVSTLRRAREKLKVKPEKSGMEGVWQLRLSDGLHTPAEGAQP